MRLRQTVLVLPLFVLVLGPLTARAQEEATIQGEIVDLRCYMSRGRHGVAHKACAVTCAKNGSPIGVLTDEGALYLLLDDRGTSDSYQFARRLAGERATVSGRTFNKQGVSSIVISSVKPQY